MEQTDLYSYFFEKGISLLNSKGMFGIIVANKWMRANYGEPLRRWLKEQNIIEIVDFGDLQIFENATTYPCIFIASKESNHKIPNLNVTSVKTLEFKDLDDYVNVNKMSIRKDNLDNSSWNLVSPSEQDLLMKLQKASITFGEYVKDNIFRGVLSGFDEAFVIDEITKDNLVAKDRNSLSIIKPYLAGKDIKRYLPPKSNKFLIFTRRGIDINKFPAIKEYLLKFKDRLMPRPKNWQGKEWKGRKEGNYSWYEIQDSVDYFQEFEKPKIVYLKFQVKPAFTFDLNSFFVNSAGFIIPTDDKYLIGILNSRLGWYSISKCCTQIQNGFQLIFQYFSKIPIKRIDDSNSIEMKIHDEIIECVEAIYEFQNKLTSATIPAEQEQLKNRIASKDKQIDKLVYELYGLTEDEIKIVEESGAK